MARCEKCGKETKDIFVTIYGELRCELCYDDYLMTDRGKPEYLFGIVTGQLDVADYDSDFLGHVSTCWNKYRDDFNISLMRLYELEAKAKAMGLL